MTTTANVYERLYDNMKARFTVVNGGNECSLGEFMLMKAGKKRESGIVPATTTALRHPSAITSFFSYVNDKLMVKEAPAKDKVIKAFPFRTTAAAVLSALLVCTFAVSYGAAAVNSITDSQASYASVCAEDVEESDYETEAKG